MLRFLFVSLGAVVALLLATPRSQADASGTATLWIAQEGEQEDLRWLCSGLLSGASFQVLYRDGGSPGGAANTSNALAVVFQ